MPSLRTHRKGKKETREVWFDHIYWDSHIFWNTSIIQGILAPPLFWTGRPGWFTCPCSWVWSWGRRAPPRRPWSASAGHRGRNLRPWTVLPILLFFNLAQSYLQVLGLDPVDVMAVGALPHHLTSNGTAPPTQLTKLTKELTKVMAPPKMTKRGWMPTWCFSDFMSVPCVSSWKTGLVKLVLNFLPASPCCSSASHPCPWGRGGRWPSPALREASFSTEEDWLTVCLAKFRSAVRVFLFPVKLYLLKCITSYLLKVQCRFVKLSWAGFSDVSLSTVQDGNADHIVIDWISDYLQYGLRWE